MILSVSGALEQDVAGRAPELLRLGFGIQPSDQVPQPREPHRPSETERLLPHRAEFHFLPALRPEELRALRGRELERGVPGGYGAPPGLFHHFEQPGRRKIDRKSTRLNSSHSQISYAVFCLKKKIHPPLLPCCPIASRAHRRSVQRV